MNVRTLRALREQGEQRGETLHVRPVDGAAVRGQRDVEFALGGHHWRYGWIPPDEVWVERGVTDRVDWIATVVHEVAERMAMRDLGMGYDHAHAVASATEAALRAQLGGEHAGRADQAE